MKKIYSLSFFACLTPIFLLLSCASVSFESEPLSSSQHEETRRVIFTADDYGASEDINEEPEEELIRSSELELFCVSSPEMDRWLNQLNIEKTRFSEL